MVTVRLQAEATLLKRISSGGSETQVIVLGIGKVDDDSELRDIASPPHDKNVIRVKDFSRLPSVEALLRNNTCNGKHLS